MNKMNLTTINIGYKTDKIRNTIYEIKKLRNKEYIISSDYSPYNNFSNSTLIKYIIRLTDKKGVIEKIYFSDLTGFQNTIKTKNKIFVSKTELNDIMADINRDLIAYHNDIINDDTMDDLTKEQYDIIEQLYNIGA